MIPLSRRRFLTITAASAALPSQLWAAPSAHWRGVALGASASMRFDGLTADEAAPIFAKVEAEINRLEAIFSLHRPSEITRLNRDGYLAAPSPDLLEVLSLAATLHTETDGHFDPTVQPLWTALATGATRREIDQARSMIGFGKIKFGATSVRLNAPENGPARPAITLNGIAQGAITDRVCNLLRAQGLENVLMDIGEISAIGRRRDGTPWQVGIADPAGTLQRTLALSDRALATSATHGTILGRDAALGHIIDPTVAHAAARRLASVSAKSAAMADGLSTALCLMPKGKTAKIMRRFPDAKIELFA